MGAAAFSDRIATRRRLWWEVPPLPRGLGEVAQRRHGCDLPALYWAGSSRRRAPFESLPGKGSTRMRPSGPTIDFEAYGYLAALAAIDPDWQSHLPVAD
jgi:hypothetical protein